VSPPDLPRDPLDRLTFLASDTSAEQGVGPMDLRQAVAHAFEHDEAFRARFARTLAECGVNSGSHCGADHLPFDFKRAEPYGGAKTPDSLAPVTLNIPGVRYQDCLRLDGSVWRCHQSVSRRRARQWSPWEWFVTWRSEPLAVDPNVAWRAVETFWLLVRNQAMTRSRPAEGE
jgi:hypothetical protein